MIRNKNKHRSKVTYPDIEYNLAPFICCLTREVLREHITNTFIDEDDEGVHVAKKPKVETIIDKTQDMEVSESSIKTEAEFKIEVKTE